MEERANLSQGALSLAWVLAGVKEKGNTRRESNGKENVDRSEYVRVFETFFESIFPIRVFHHITMDSLS